MEELSSALRSSFGRVDSPVGSGQTDLAVEVRFLVDATTKKFRQFCGLFVYIQMRIQWTEHFLLLVCVELLTCIVRLTTLLQRSRDNYSLSNYAQIPRTKLV